MTTVTPTTIEAMITSGDAQIADLERSIAAITDQIDTCHDEQDQAGQAYHRRCAELGQLTNTVQSCAKEHDEATGYAILARDKPTAQQSIKAVATAKKALDGARAQLARHTQDHEEANRAASAQDVAVKQRLADCQTELETHREQLQRLAAGRDKAIAEQGEHLFASLCHEQDTLLATVARIEQELIAAQADLSRQQDDALHSLAGWGHLQQAMRHRIASDDDTAQALAAALFYASTLLGCRNVAELPVELRARGFSLGENITIHPEIVLQSPRYPQNLAFVRDRIKKTLDAYREHRAKSV